ncbi:MAG: ABC transporter ATP-binding protein [Ignavibacteriae bacterium]|nr:ABC transporter ATP-binding protein [Ignavibacteriota bacterium]
MESSIRVENISKSFESVKAVNNISFDVAEGELFGLIGPDGAGKTTLFKMLTSLLIPDNGQAFVEGFHTVNEYKKIRNIIGYMPSKFSLYQDLTVEENLNFFATIFGTTIEKNYELLEEIYVQIEPFKKRRAGKLSGGMKQKLALCCALVHEPKVLFLDEPTTGVDAVSRAEFWEMLKRLKEKGITILVSTPYMDEASLCERIALIQDGKIPQIDTPENIKNNYGKPLFSVRSNDFYRLLNEMRKQPFAERVEAFGEYLHLTTNDGVSEKQILDYLQKSGHSKIELNKIDATIEDVFLDLMETEE